MSLLAMLALASSPVAAMESSAFFIPAKAQQEVVEKRSAPKREPRSEKKDSERGRDRSKRSDWCTSDGMTVRCDLFRDSTPPIF